MEQQETPPVSTESGSLITRAGRAVETARLRVMRKVEKTQDVLSALGPREALKSLVGITPQEPKHGRAQELFGPETVRRQVETLRRINRLDELRAERDKRILTGKTGVIRYNYVLTEIKGLEAGLLKK